MKLGKLLLPLFLIFPLAACNQPATNSQNNPNNPSGEQVKSDVVVVWNEVYNDTVNPISSYSISGVTFNFDKGSGTSAPAYYKSYNNNVVDAVRLYAKNEMSVSSSTAIKSIVMNMDETNGGKPVAEVTASTGSLSTPTDNKTMTWSGNSKNVKFTLGDSGQRRITSVTISFGEADSSSGGGSQSDEQGGSQTDDLQLDILSYIIDLLFEEEPLEDDNYYIDTDGSLYTGYYYDGQYNENDMLDAVNDAISYLPSDFVEYIEPTYEPEDDYYYACAYADYINEDESYVIDIFVTYDDEEDSLFVYISVYTMEQFDDLYGDY